MRSTLMLIVLEHQLVAPFGIIGKPIRIMPRCVHELDVEYKFDVHVVSLISLLVFTLVANGILTIVIQTLLRTHVHSK